MLQPPCSVELGGKRKMHLVPAQEVGRKRIESCCGKTAKSLRTQLLHHLQFFFFKQRGSVRQLEALYVRNDEISVHIFVSKDHAAKTINKFLIMLFASLR
jgi:hypothetical protein